MTTTDESPGPLAETLRAWKTHKRVSVAHIVKYSGVARNTIDMILRGDTRRPTAATLAAVARGVITDPATLELPAGELRRCHQSLRAAAGYGEASVETTASLLRFGLWLRLRSWALVDAWEAAIERYAGLEPDDVLALAPRRRRPP